MAYGARSSAHPDVLSMYLRLDAGDARVIARGDVRRVGDGWAIELRCAGSDAAPYRALHAPENASIILWLMTLLDVAGSVPGQ